MESPETRNGQQKGLHPLDDHPYSHITIDPRPKKTKQRDRLMEGGPFREVALSHKVEDLEWNQMGAPFCPNLRKSQRRRELLILWHYTVDDGWKGIKRGLEGQTDCVETK